MKINSKKLESDLRIKCLGAFFKAVGYANSKNSVKQFLSDVLTESEQVMIGRRVLIAKRLLEGKKYRWIVKELGVGQDTVYSVKKWLGGRHKGIEKVVERVRKVVSSRLKRKSEFLDYYPTGGFAEIRRKYRSYYWLSELLDEINDK